MKNLIIANWKMNPASQKEAKELFDAVKKATRAANETKATEVVICPPFIYASSFKFQDSGMALGVQNVSAEPKGAFTGQISANQLKDLEVEYVIVGHSEARKHNAETDEIINKKLKAVLGAGMIPVLCVGEQEGEDKVRVLETQITEAFKSIAKKDAENVIVAYEPVWAIGTGKNCSPDETIQAALLIKKALYHLYDEDFSRHMKVLYGGSVKSTNAAEYLKSGGVQGFIIGGASLDAEEFAKIVAVA